MWDPRAELLQAYGSNAIPGAPDLARMRLFRRCRPVACVDRMRERLQYSGEDAAQTCHEYDGDAAVYPGPVGLQANHNVCEVECPESDCDPGHVFGPRASSP